jgi:lysophospholipase L1-like esterase
MQSTSRFKKFPIIFSILIVFLWAFTRPSNESTLLVHVTHFTLFIIPIISQIFKKSIIKVYGVWFAVFLILHGYISMELKPKMVTQTKNLRYKINVKDGLPGIEGVQNVSTDEKGFRTTKDIYYLNKEDRVYRIFALGASTTEQIYLDDKDTWTHKLQEILGKTSKKEIEVINTGVSGVRLEQNLQTLNSIMEYKPDMVLFLVGINDWNRQIHDSMGHPPEPQRERFHKIKKLQDKLSFEKSLIGRAVLSASIQSKGGLNNKELIIEGKYDDLRGSLYNKVKKTYKPQTVSKNYKENLNIIVKACHESEVKCVFITQPNGYKDEVDEDYKKGFWMTPPNTDYTLDMESLKHISSLYNDFLIDYSKENNIYLCDLEKDIPPSYDYMYDECHFNTKGAEKVAHSLKSCLSTIIK